MTSIVCEVRAAVSKLQARFAACYEFPGDRAIACVVTGDDPTR
jgi:hypothetical protein